MPSKKVAIQKSASKERVKVTKAKAAKAEKKAAKKADPHPFRTGF